MANREVTIREWECDRCGKKVRPDTRSSDPPPGWTVQTKETGAAGRPYSKGMDLCPVCSRE